MGGSEPWPGVSLFDVGMRKVKGETPEGQLEPDCPPALRQLMVDCWSFNPNDRPTMREVHSRLAAREAEVMADAAAYASASEFALPSPAPMKKG